MSSFKSNRFDLKRGILNFDWGQKMRFFIFWKYYRKIILRAACSKYFQNISISRIFRKNIFVFQGFNNNKRFDHFRKTSQVIDHMLFYMTKKVQSSVISLKFVGRKRFQISNEKIYIFIYIFLKIKPLRVKYWSFFFH